MLQWGDRPRALPVKRCEACEDKKRAASAEAREGGKVLPKPLVRRPSRVG